MINIPEITRQLAANAEAIRAMIQTIGPEQAQWKPDSETWSMLQVMNHVYNEERIDFRKHLKEMLGDPPQPWALWKEEEQVPVTELQQGLKDFLQERQDSLAWLKALAQAPVDWDFSQPTPWRSSIRAGDVLVSWVEHDFLHMRQMNELLHAWNIAQAAPYKVDYAGEW